MKTRLLITLFASVIFTPVVNATIIATDLTSTGDGYLTYDSATGLEWLDVPLTMELSFNQATETTYVQDLGFRHATDTEIRGLLASFGITDLTGVRVEENYVGVRLMLDLMGPGYNSGTLEVLSGFYAPTASMLVGWLSVDAPISEDTINGRARISPDVFRVDLPQEGTGNFLVREVADIPVPPAIWLLTTGYLGLLMRKREQT